MLRGHRLSATTVGISQFYVWGYLITAVMKEHALQQRWPLHRHWLNIDTKERILALRSVLTLPMPEAELVGAKEIRAMAAAFYIKLEEE